MSLEL
jgi:Tfp pilus assembly ATPase PilU